MRTTGYRRDGRDGLGDNVFLSIQVLIDRLPINHLLQLQQREAVDMLGNHGLGRSQLGVLYTRFKKRCLSGDEPACR